MKSLDLSFKDIDKIIELLKAGKVGVIPTDTIYGIVGFALSPATVESIYKLRRRSTDKPLIILISNLNDLSHFNVVLTEKQRSFLRKNWPNPLSVVLPCLDEKFFYLHRGQKSLAFRIPKDKNLLKILTMVRPLVAPSANFEGEKPAETVSEAKKYFDDQVYFYIDGGTLRSIPSTIITLSKNGFTKVVRQGGYKLV